MQKLLIRIALVMLVVMLTLSACAAPARTTQAPPTQAIPKTTTAPVTTTSSAPTYRPPVITTAPATTTAAPTSTGNIGLAAGGAKDIGNFRENIRNNYLPLPTDVSYEGLFYDYYFDTGATEPSNKLYSPSYSYAVTRDPLSGKTDYYLSVGLNSGLKESDFQRKKLNLVVVLDDSGSMGSNYNQYYYDQFGTRIDAYADEGVIRQAKMDSANEAVVNILNQLNDSDRFSIVLFNSNSFLAQPMGLVRQTDMRTVRNKVLDVHAGGSTNLYAGIQMATDQFRNFYEINNYEYENRIIVLTDAQPNTGDFSSTGLFSILQKNAGNRIYTTFIGIGVDFNSQLIDEITKIKGSNYYTVRSPREFRSRINDEFEYMVTPLVFNLRLNFQSAGWRIEKVFGSPEANQATGELMKINTLFASKSEGGETKGGLVLLKLRKMSVLPEEKVNLRVTYDDRNGRSDSSEEVIVLESTQPEYFANSGIRKGVLLSRYAALLKNWMLDERQHVQYSQPWDACIRQDTGIIIPVETNLSQWERQSLPLMVSAPYKDIFRNFSRYFASEINALGDNTLSQELRVLDYLSR